MKLRRLIFSNVSKGLIWLIVWGILLQLRGSVCASAVGAEAISQKPLGKDNLFPSF